MHLLKAEEILRIHDAVLERFGGLKSQPMTPDAGLSKAQALVGRIRSAMTYNTAYDWNNVFLCAAFLTHCIARAHAFADGNKRTALNAAGLLLKRAGGTGARPNQVRRNRRTPANRNDRLREVHGRPRTLRSIRHTGIQENFPANAAAPSRFR